MLVSNQNPPLVKQARHHDNGGSTYRYRYITKVHPPHFLPDNPLISLSDYLFAIVHISFKCVDTQDVRNGDRERIALFNKKNMQLYMLFRQSRWLVSNSRQSHWKSYIVYKTEPSATAIFIPLRTHTHTRSARTFEAHQNTQTYTHTHINTHTPICDAQTRTLAYIYDYYFKHDSMTTSNPYAAQTCCRRRSCRRQRPE